MPGRADGDAGGEVEEAVAVDVGDDHARSGLGDERVRARQGRAGDGLVAGDDRASPRAGQLGDDVGAIGSGAAAAEDVASMVVMRWCTPWSERRVLPAHLG